MPAWIDASTISLALGGALGAFAHVLATTQYSWLSKLAAVDVLIGAALGVVVPLLPVQTVLGLAGITIALPVVAQALTPVEKGALMFLLTLATSGTLRERILNRWQPPERNRRAEDHPGGPAQ